MIVLILILYNGFSMLQNIVSGQFLAFLLKLQNAVIIMEDCEYILKRRDTHENPLINSLLNITDGLVGDALNIRFYVLLTQH